MKEKTPAFEIEPGVTLPEKTFHVFSPGSSGESMQVIEGKCLSSYYYGIPSFSPKEACEDLVKQQTNFALYRYRGIFSDWNTKTESPELQELEKRTEKLWNLTLLGNKFGI